MKNPQKNSIADYVQRVFNIMQEYNIGEADVRAQLYSFFSEPGLSTYRNAADGEFELLIQKSWKSLQSYGQSLQQSLRDLAERGEVDSEEYDRVYHDQIKVSNALENLTRVITELKIGPHREGRQ